MIGYMNALLQNKKKAKSAAWNFGRSSKKAEKHETERTQFLLKGSLRRALRPGPAPLRRACRAQPPGRVARRSSAGSSCAWRCATLRMYVSPGLFGGHVMTHNPLVESSSLSGPNNLRRIAFAVVTPLSPARPESAVFMWSSPCHRLGCFR